MVLILCLGYAHHFIVTAESHKCAATGSKDLVSSYNDLSNTHKKYKDVKRERDQGTT